VRILSSQKGIRIQQRGGWSLSGTSTEISTRHGIFHLNLDLDLDPDPDLDPDLDLPHHMLLDSSRAFKLGGFMDDDYRWVGGDTVVVQVQTPFCTIHVLPQL